LVKLDLQAKYAYVNGTKFYNVFNPTEFGYSGDNGKSIYFTNIGVN